MKTLYTKQNSEKFQTIYYRLAISTLTQILEANSFLIALRARRNALLDDRGYLVICISGNINRENCASLQSSRKDGENIFSSFRSTIGENETISYIPSIGNRACHFPENGPSTEYTHTLNHGTKLDSSSRSKRHDRSRDGKRDLNENSQYRRGEGIVCRFRCLSYREIFSAFVLSFYTHGTVVHVMLYPVDITFSLTEIKMF